MWTSQTCCARRDVVTTAMRHGRACVPSAGGKSTSGYGRNRSRMTGPWQKSKIICIITNSFTPGLKTIEIVFAVQRYYYLDAIMLVLLKTSLAFYAPLNIKCPWHQATARGGGSVCQQSRSADTVPLPVHCATATPRTRLLRTLLQVWGEEDQWEDTESDHR